MAKSKEPKIIKIHTPSTDRFIEQVEGKRYCQWIGYLALGELSDKGEVDYKNVLFGEGNVEFHPLLKTPWKLCSEPTKCNFKELWSEVKEYIYAHIDLLDDRLFDVLTAWVFATWILEYWDVVGYLRVLSPKSSGKTRLLNTLRYISYRGCKSSDISESALYRTVEKWHPTLFLDESEIYSKGLRENIQSLLNSGYSRDDVVIRVKDPRTDELGFFETFGFKAIAGTEPLRDTLESRCIQINMSKNTRPVNRRIDERKALMLRNKLLYWRFRMLERLSVDGSEGYGCYLRDERDCPELGWCDGRFNELYFPLVMTCKLIEESSKSCTKGEEGQP